MPLQQRDTGGVVAAKPTLRVADAPAPQLLPGPPAQLDNAAPPCSPDHAPQALSRIVHLTATISQTRPSRTPAPPCVSPPRQPQPPPRHLPALLPQQS